MDCRLHNSLTEAIFDDFAHMTAQNSAPPADCSSFSVLILLDLHLAKNFLLINGVINK